MDPTETLNTKVADPNCLQHLTERRRPPTGLIQRLRDAHTTPGLGFRDQGFQRCVHGFQRTTMMGMHCRVFRAGFRCRHVGGFRVRVF